MVGSGGGSSARSESDKEKTKLRERQRRGITTKIFHGLRRYGGYHLSPRADINEVLRELAKEAGWIIEPDGTTYRYKLVNRCPTCGAGPSQASTTATPTASSTLVAGGGSGSGGDCSTTTSPRRIDPSMALINGVNSGRAVNGGAPNSVGSSSGEQLDISPAFYIYNHPDLLHQPSIPTTTNAVAEIGMPVNVPSVLHHQELLQLQGAFMEEAIVAAAGPVESSPRRN
ncbi:unnamed protein product [Linum tenue]|uniref:Protein BZR1 homolog n=1 Tax=Linum tenue TaxID=586396 RepID=A0AAV0QJ45_9ROSI|nr:unnamed protein product [Linum tenue]